MTSNNLPGNPQHDPGFIERALNDLLEHRGEWRRIGRLHVSPDCPSHERCDAAAEAVRIGRRLGFVIDGHPQKGYRFVRWQRPLYLHVKPLVRAIDAIDARAAGGEG